MTTKLMVVHRITFFSILKGVIFFLCTNLNAQPDYLNFDNFTLDNGLSNNIIHCASQDYKGYMWFGTNLGVCRYDGYEFTTFRSSPGDSTSLSGLITRVIFEDSRKNLWIGTESGGLNLFDRNNEKFIHILPEFDDASIGTSVKTIDEDKKGLLWIGTNIGVKVFDPTTWKVKTYAYDEKNSNSPSDNYIRVLRFDDFGKLWVGTNNGLDVFDQSTGKFTRLAERDPRLRDEIWEIFKGPDGKIWVGTYNNGLFIFDPQTLQDKQIIIDKTNDRSKTIRSVICDKSGLYWIGSRGGLYVYNYKENKANLFENDEREARSLVHNSILDIACDKKGDIWICTRGGISLVVPERQVFRRYKSLPDDNRFLNNSEVYAIWTEPGTGNVWLGTDKGGVNILDRRTNRFSYLMKQPGNPNSLSGNCIKAFMDDGKGNVWIGIFQGGINIYNLKTKHITRMMNNPADINSLPSNNVWALVRDKKGYIWVGTDNGLSRYDEPTNSFIRYADVDEGQSVNWINEDLDGNLWLGAGSRFCVYCPFKGVISRFDEQARCFYEDSKKRYWVATLNNGLVQYDVRKGPVKYYSEKDGLPNNQVFYITQDDLGYLWLSTANGLAKFDPDKEEFMNFDSKDGLQNNQFLYGGGYKSPTGELIFGGINGINIFDPKLVVKNTYEPPIVFTDLKIFNKSVETNDKTHVLKQCISETRQITLPYRYNVLTFEFAALNFSKSERNRYKYKLQGFEDDWNESGFKRSATYTNLDPGEYTFRVLASNNDNVWNDKGISMKVTILPPYWKTWWFKSLIIIFILCVVYFLIVFFVNREKLKHELVFERVKAKNIHELDMMKLRFFTNISHEIRTPLTLILGPIEKMIQNDIPPTEVKNHLNIMHRNARQLLKLINQLLDYRKLESGNLKLELRKGDVVAFVREAVSVFEELAREKGIKFKFNSVNDQIFTFFDADKLEKIVNNLLSNAFKFTDKGGAVTINLSLIVDNTDNTETAEQKFIELVVRDTGIGIHESNIERIFTRFFQSDSNQKQSGTGIGLALTKELVKIHKGQIFVESKAGKGTKFRVRLPFKPELFNEAEQEQAEQIVPIEDSVEISGNHFVEDENSNENILLIVEDNADVRYFIRSNFDTQFRVIEAADGKEGYNAAIKYVPDVIISDILMPGYDGNELCRKLKKDERTSHIPILLLTALSSKEHTMEGLSSGADDYITKPFDINLLRIKIENLISLRTTLKEKFSGELVLQPTNIAITSPDERFLKKAIEVVEKYIDDPNLDIEKFSLELNVSRMQLYRKLSALTNMTVKEFIRDIRLKRAAQLIIQKKLTISEVAYSVGFKDLSHFRKCFREEFGMSATEYTEKHSA